MASEDNPPQADAADGSTDPRAEPEPAPSKTDPKQADPTPRIVAGSINIKALEQALTIPDAKERLDKILEIALAATPNDSTSPTLPREQIMGVIKGPAREMDKIWGQLADQRAGIKDKVTEFATQHHQSLSRYTELAVHVFGNGVPPKEGASAEQLKLSLSVPEPKAPPISIEEQAKRKFAGQILTWHLGDVMFANGLSLSPLTQNEKIPLIQAAVDVSMHALHPKLPERILFQSPMNLGFRLNSILKLVRNNPGIFENSEAGNGLIHQLEKVRRRDLYLASLGDNNVLDVADTTTLNILAEIGGPNAVRLSAEIVGRNPSEEIKTVAIDTLGKIGHADPRTAVLAIKQAGKGITKLEGNVSQALDRIAESCAAGCNVTFTDFSALWEVINPILRADGIGSITRNTTIHDAASKTLPKGTDDLARIAIGMMKPRHPIQTRAGAKVLATLQRTGMRSIGNTTMVIKQI